MRFPAIIKRKYIPTTKNSVSESLHITVGADFAISEGDTFVIDFRKPKIVEIKKKTYPIYPVPYWNIN